MIDLKSDARASYPFWTEAIADYTTLLHSAGHRHVGGPVIIFLSGNRPKDAVLKDPAAPVALDGRPEDVGKGYAASVMPVISDTYTKWSTWNGRDRPAPEALRKIRDLAQRVHAEGKKLRLWSIPDNPIAWQELLEAGVDLINTDNLKELNQFLKSLKKK